jgi:RNA recognition motif-containing protein
MNDSTHNNSSSKDGKTLALSGLTFNISEEDLVARLEPFGPVTSLTRKLPAYALVTFGEARHADEALKALCGSSVQSWTKSASIAAGMGPAAARPAAGRGTKHKARAKSNILRTMPVLATRIVSVSLLENPNQAVKRRGIAIKVLWYAPSRCAWVHFATVQMATAAARACDGVTFGGQQHQHQQRRFLTASVQAPTRGLQRSFSVWIGGLPDLVREEELKCFVHKHSKQWVTSVALGDVPFPDNQGAVIVKTLLEQHGGRLVHF